MYRFKTTLPRINGNPTLHCYTSDGAFIAFVRADFLPRMEKAGLIGRSIEEGLHRGIGVEKIVVLADNNFCGVPISKGSYISPG